MDTGEAAERLPLLRFAPMPHQTRIRLNPRRSALLLALLSGGFSFAQDISPVTDPATQFSIALLPPNQMTPADRADAESWRQAIAGSAQFYGYTVDSSYSYREIACPVAPNHLILAYEATASNGTISRFTIVVRRAPEEETAGRHASAEIIPILHAGVVPFVRAIANPHSIEIFNAAISAAPSATEVLAAAQKGSQPLLVRSLCYLAMVGEEPAALRSPPVDLPTIHAPVPTLAFFKRGQMQQMISIRSSPGDYQVWALNFVAGGKLLSASRAEHPIDRTPLVLDANAASPAPPAVPAAPISIEPAAGVVTAAPPAVAATTALTPTPPTAATAPVASVAPALTPGSTGVEMTNNTSSVGESVTAPMPASSAATVQSTAAQPVTAALPTAASLNSTPPPASQPPAPVAVPATSMAAARNTPPVKAALPLPPYRLITNLPSPPSRVIPDSALKTPPHLPQ